MTVQKVRKMKVFFFMSPLTPKVEAQTSLTVPVGTSVSPEAVVTAVTEGKNTAGLAERQRHAVSWIKWGKNARGFLSLWASGQKTSSVFERMQKTSPPGSYSKGLSDTCCHEVEGSLSSRECGLTQHGSLSAARWSFLATFCACHESPRVTKAFPRSALLELPC